MNYVYDIFGNQVAEISSSGVWNRGEVYAGSRHLATYVGGEAGTEQASGGGAINTHSFEPLVFMPVAPFGGLVGAPGGVGFYAGTPNVGGGAYVNVTTNAGCGKHK